MLKLIRQFIAENAARLGDQLAAFEQNVATETLALYNGMIAQPAQVRFTPQTSPAATLSTRQIAICEGTTGNVAFVVGQPADGKPGFAWVLKRALANTVTVRPSGMAGGVARTINGTTSKTYAAATNGLFALYYDGANWWAA